MRCAARGELLGVRRPGGYDFLYPAWQFGPDGKPLPVIERLVHTARGAGLSDERLYELLAARTGISGDARLADALREGKDEYVLSVVRGIVDGPRQPERRSQVVRQPNRARRARLRDRAARPRRRHRRQRLR